MKNLSFFLFVYVYVYELFEKKKNCLKIVYVYEHFDEQKHEK